MPDLSLSQKAALRAALAAHRHMLIKSGKHYSTHFVGGQRVRHTTVQSLLLLDLLRRVDGSTAVCLTASGLSTARALQLEYEQAAATATAKREHSARLGRENYARTLARKAGHQPPTQPAQPVQPFTTRLPYADN